MALKGHINLHRGNKKARFDFHQNELFSVPDGGDKRDRTADLLNAIQALSQLSYTPYFPNILKMSTFYQKNLPRIFILILEKYMRFGLVALATITAGIALCAMPAAKNLKFSNWKMNTSHGQIYAKLP